MAKPAPEFSSMLNVLVEHEVEFIIVGGISAVLHGAPISTFDLDVLYRPSPENAARSVAALEEMQAVYRGRMGQVLKPQASWLLGGGHHLFRTALGDLDFLSFVGEQHKYDDLLPLSEQHVVASLCVQMLSLEAIVKIAHETGRDKDRLRIPIYEAMIHRESPGSSDQT